MTDKILILDFGSQVTQLIARRVRENGVYCEIQPYTTSEERIRAFAPRGIILSGGPASVTVATTPRAPDIVFSLGVPVLAICYGMQTMCAQLGGRVTLSDHQEFGRAFIDVRGECRLFEGLWPPGAREQVWMSHGDKIDALPSGFRAVAASEGAPYAAIADDERRLYGVLFHPEVVHTPQGGKLLRNFTHHVAGCQGDWTMAGWKDRKSTRLNSSHANISYAVFCLQKQRGNAARQELPITYGSMSDCTNAQARAAHYHWQEIQGEHQKIESARRSTHLWQ